MILFVDDEERYIEPYLAEFRMSGYNPVHRIDVDAALRFFIGNLKQIEIVIVDVMMQPGDAFGDEETKKGLRTGIVFYKKVREHTADLPIIILTNVADREVSNLLVMEKNCWLYRKRDVLPFELVEEVQKVLANMSEKEKAN